MALYGAWQISGWPAGHRELISDLSFVPVSLGAALGAWSASRRFGCDPRLRTAWRLIALACASYCAGDLTWLLYALLGKSPYPSPADGFYLLFYPSLFWGLLKLPARRQTTAAAMRLGLDTAIVAVGGAALVAYVVVWPTLAQGGSTPLTTAFSVAYPVGDMILLLGLASVLLRGGPSIVLRLIASGLVCFVAADLVLAYISLHGTYPAGDPVDALWMAAMALFAIAAEVQQPAATATAPAVQEIRAASWLPYLAPATTLALLVANEAKEHFSVAFMLVLASVVLTALISTRQFLTQRDLLEARRQLRFDSLHDGLTGLANRSLLAAQAEQMLARARRTGGRVAALYLDLDSFKAINDTFGHAVGDEVLKIVGRRICTAVREHDVVGRIGGDEFVILLDGVEGEEEALEVSERVARLFATPIQLDALPGYELDAEPSIGVTVGADATFEELLRGSDAAMYDAKRAKQAPGDARDGRALRPITAFG